MKEHRIRSSIPVLWEAGYISEKVIRYISKHPGSSFSEIMRTLGLNESTLRYHLEKFERDGLITSKKIGRQRCYFSLEEKVGVGSKGGGLTVIQKRVLNCIREHPRISRKEIINRINGPPSTVTEALGSLMKSGKIVKVRTDVKIGYEHVSKKELKNRLFKRLVVRLVNGEIDEHVFNELVEELDRTM
ncbi:MAG: winged helix-turn-helix transcriptional regulator [Candidatus Thermoplasmatota archaeon]|nr:winged helix-turn-helix transcriptional regulator [Candidatus Thermoplasmatota archaeon]